MDATPQRPPFEMAGYEVLRRIGRGAYGDVWLARTAVGGLYRAIKVVYRDRFPEGSRAFETEFKGLERFTQGADRLHRQLAILHAVMQPAGDVFYYVMELADDVERREGLDPATYRPLTLQALRAQGFGDARKWLRLAVDLADALVELHDVVDVAHRDIKPNNLIIVSGHLKIADIGLVTSTAEMASGQGTPDFLANYEYGNRTKADDIWCAGKVLYFMLFGTIKGFPSPLRAPEYARILSDPLFWELNYVIIKACETEDLAKRYASAAELAADLKTIDAGGSVRQSQELRRRLAAMRRYASVAATAAVVLAAAFATWVVVDVLRERSAAVELERQERSLGFLQMAVDAVGRDAFRLAGAALTNAWDLAPKAMAGLVEYGAAADVVRAKGLSPAGMWEGPTQQGVVRITVSQDGSTTAAFVRPGGIEGNEPGSILVFTNRPFGLSGTLTNVKALGGFIPGSTRIVFTDPKDVLYEAAADAPDSRLACAPTKGRGALLASRDGGTLLFKGPSKDPAGGTDLFLWDTLRASEAYRWVLRMDGATWEPRVGVVSISGNQVVAACSNSQDSPATEALYGFEVGNPTPSHVATHLSNVWAIDVSPDGRFFAVGGHARDIHVLDMQTWAPVRQVETQQAGIRSLMYLPDSLRLAAGDSLGNVWIYGLQAESHIRTAAHATTVESLAWQPASNRMVSGGSDGRVRLWEDREREPGPYLRTHWAQSGGGFLAASNSAFVLVTTTNGSVAQVDLFTHQQTKEFKGLLQPLAWKIPDRVFLALDVQCEVVRVDVGTGTMERTGLSCPSDRADTPLVRVSPSGNLAAVVIEKAQGGANWLLWDLRNEAELGGNECENRTATVAFSHDDTFALFLGSDSGQALIRLDLTNRCESLLALPRMTGSVMSMAISPDSTLLAVGLDHGSVAEIPLGEPGAEPRIHPGHGGPVHCLAFSKDGRRLLSGGDEGTVAVMSVPGFRKLVQLPVYDSPWEKHREDPAVHDLSFSMAGGHFHAWTAGGTLRTWKAAP